MGNTDNSIRLSSSQRRGKTLYVIAFVLTALGVYLWGNSAARRAPDRLSATARVICHPVGQSGGSAHPIKIDLETAKTHITAEENFEQAIRQARRATGQRPESESEIALDEAVSSLRGNLTISEEALTSGTTKVSLTYASEDAKSATDKHMAGDYATRLVNELAAIFADDCRRQWKADTNKVLVEARSSRDEADRTYLRAQSRKDAFLAAKVKELETPTADPPESQQPTGPTPQQMDPVPHENPEWTSLNDKLTLLDAERRQLLTTRTALHPEVEDIQLRIDDLKLKLADRQRWLVPEDESPIIDNPIANPAEEQINSGVAEEQQNAETEKILAALEAEVERTKKVYDLAAEAEHRASREHSKDPPIEVELATVRVAEKKTADNQLGLLYAALAAGVGVVSGMGLISFGTSLDPLLTSVESVEAALAAPVVGVVRASSELEEPSADHQLLIRTTTIIGGVAVIVGSGAAVFLTLGMR